MREKESETVVKTWEGGQGSSWKQGLMVLLCGGPVHWRGARLIDLIWPTGARYEHTMLKTGRLVTNYIKQLQPLTPQEACNWMPEHNTMAYSRHRKEKGWDGKSLITFHSHPTSHSRDFTCFGFQRGTSTESYSSSHKLRTTAHKCANTCVNAYAITRYVICQDWYSKITNYWTS
jgi:hypothetical protein